MRVRRVQIYVAAMTAAAVMCLFLLDWESLPQDHLVGLAWLTALGILAFSVAFRVEVGRTNSHSSITFIPLLASLVLFGPAAAVALAATIQLIGEYWHRKRPLKATFNVAQWIVTGTLTGLVYGHLSDIVGMPPSAVLTSTVGGQLLIPFGGAVVTFFLANYAAVTVAIALDKHLPLRDVFRNIAGTAGANLVYGILISPLALLVAVLYVHLDYWGFLISLLPLVFIRRSYQNNIRLAGANRDLLKALVKAIETRDPYTSGHSLRVSRLAKRIATTMGLPARQVEEIETAALLHDIGKIDAIYTDILGKSAPLSDEERVIIQSHVIKGVELLQSMASLEPTIIAAVRHHHEREDGKGYPDRLTSTSIPIGAKIIKVCDAVDAMLSDRPYRRALDLSKVREQLITYAGTQFDVQVVQATLTGSILRQHRAEVVASKDWSAMTTLDRPVKHKNYVASELQGSLRDILAIWRGHNPGKDESIRLQ